MLANRNFIIQTRNTDQKLFSEAIDGNLAEFYRNEFVERKELNYPPFSFLIKLTSSANNRAQLENDFEVLKKYFAPHELIYFPAFTANYKGRFFMNGILKIKRSKWPEKMLLDKLKNLPPQYRIEIDAQNII